MTVSLYGQNPKSDKGEVLKQSDWVWSPLINYLQINHEQISIMMDHLQFNEAYEIGPNAANAIAEIIEEDLKNGNIKKYIDNFNSLKENLDDLDCQHCFGIGKERKNILFISDEDCVVCEGKGKTRPLLCDYNVENADFETFAKFIRESEGFIIS